jgi:ABC-type histidine transport system ATPase subunit
VCIMEENNMNTRAAARGVYMPAVHRACTVCVHCVAGMRQQYNVWLEICMGSDVAECIVRVLRGERREICSR